MIGMRIGAAVRMAVIMMVMKVVTVIVRMRVVVMMRMRVAFLLLAGTGAFAVAQEAAAADALDMMVVAHLRRPDLGFEAEHLGPIFAQATIHAVVAVEKLGDAIAKGLDDQAMIIELRGVDELDPGMILCHPIGMAVDAADEHAAEQEIGEDDNAREAELH